MRKKISLILKILICSFAFLGIALAMVFAQQDGYSHWSKRLLYFTQQSNLWIGAICLIIATLQLTKSEKGASSVLYLIRFIFTVSITVTGVVYCTLLAPFADENFNAWSFGNVITHVIVPALSIADFIIDDAQYNCSKKQVFLTTVPPLAYFIFATVLCVNMVDFGRGDPYPYFFLNYYSEAGLFGFVHGDLPQLGSVYWIILFLGMVLGLGYLYRRIHVKAHNAK